MSEQNDHLLKLAGGCVHIPAWTPGEWVKTLYQCAKCGYAREGVGTYPTVGDGHEMDLGEMVRLARQSGCEVRFERDRVRVIHAGYENVRFCEDPSELEAALGAAILAAVKVME